MAADAGLGAGPLADLDGLAEGAGQELADRALALGDLPRLADLAEDLALADDHRVESGGHAEEVRDRSVLVVRVEQVGELVGVHARLVGEEVADVVDAGVEHRRAGVDLGAVARREQHRLGQVLAERERVQRLGETRRRNRHPLEQLDRDGPVVQSDDDERHVRNSSFASGSRPARIRSSMPESRARRQSASSEERPPARIASRASRQQLEQRLVLRAELAGQPLPEPGGQGRTPPARPDGDDQVAPPDHRHQGERAVGRVVGRVHPDPAGLTGLEHGPVHRRIVGRRGGEPGPVEVRGREVPLGDASGAPRRARPEPRRRAPGRRRGRRHRPRGAPRSCGRRSARRRRRRSGARRRAGSPDTRRAPRRVAGAGTGTGCAHVGDVLGGAAGRTRGSAARWRGRPCGWRPPPGRPRPRARSSGSRRRPPRPGGPRPPGPRARAWR